MDNKEPEINEDIALEEIEGSVSSDVEAVDTELDASAVIDSVWEDEDSKKTSDAGTEDDAEREDEEDKDASEETAAAQGKSYKRKYKIDLSEYEGKEIPDEVFKKLPFGLKCKHDLVIACCLLMIVFVVIGAGLYYFMSAPLLKSFDYTYDEFLEKLYASETHSQYLSSWGFKVSNTTYTVNGLIPDTSDYSEVVNNVKLQDLTKIRSEMGLKTFKSDVLCARDCGLMGAVRNSDDKLVYLRFLAKYDDVSTNPAFITYYYTTVFETIFPDLNSVSAGALVSETLRNLEGGDTGYLINDDYAFRIMLGKLDGTVYVALDITPKENVVS